MSPQTPTIGRIVLFRDLESNSAKEHPAIITRIWSDTCVNLTVFPDNAEPIVKTSVTFDDEHLDDPNFAYHWRWPPRA